MKPWTQRFLRLLGALGGRLPDDFLAELRTRLAQGHLVEVADAIVFAAVATPVALTEDDVDLLIATLAGDGAETAMARAIPRTGPVPAPSGARTDPAMT